MANRFPQASAANAEPQSYAQIRRLVASAIAGVDSKTAALDQLLVGARQVQLTDGETLAGRGDPFPFLVIVQTGELELGIVAPTGRRHVIARLTDGQTFGFVPMFEGAAIYDSRAVRATRVLLIRREAILTALRGNAALAVKLLEQHIARQRLLFEFISFQAILPPLGRTANTLLTLIGLAKPGAEAGRKPMELRLTQGDIADMMGISRQNLNTHLKALANDGLIALKYGAIEILDPAALRALGAP
ncbi:MAG: Crp/Fnr family transcriptional regulator [Gammaproteobacteria bacterium]